VLIVLTSRLIPISVISVWAIRTVTDTNQYVATMSPLARNQIIEDDLATKATIKLMSPAVQDEVRSALPANIKPLSQPVLSGVRTFVHEQSLRVFESPKFAGLWDSLNRRTHAAAVAILGAIRAST
jgi:hypothetical protein